MIDDDIIKKLYKESEQELRDTIDKMPIPTAPIVTQEDANVGYITRYFIRQVNDQVYVTEIDKTQYEDLKENPRFTTTTVKWKIIGKKETLRHTSGANLYGVEDQNRIAVADADLTFGGLRRYISSYLEYWVSET